MLLQLYFSRQEFAIPFSIYLYRVYNTVTQLALKQEGCEIPKKDKKVENP